jgi:hypothetical protein
MSAVAFSVGKGLLSQLLGFRKAPQSDGINRFVEALCECSISVEHAMAVIETFDYEFPTVREIRDAAHNLRPKFEPKVDPKEQWEKEYGKPDVEWSRRMTSATGIASDVKVDPAERKRLYTEENRAVLWQAIRDSIYYTEGPGARGPDQFWSAAMAKHNRNHPAEVAAFRVQLAECGWDQLMAVDWLKSMPVMVRPQRASVALANPITQADVDRELGRVGRETGDGE